MPLTIRAFALGTMVVVNLGCNARSDAGATLAPTPVQAPKLEHKTEPLQAAPAHLAADVDNDLFRAGESYGANDGEGIANLTYRVTALYTGRDAVLGTSAGLKHFGKRRLGAAVAST